MQKLFICILVVLLSSSCKKDNQPPTARLEVFPSFGDTSLIYEFKGGGSTDDRSYPIGLEFRWDIDGDGIWDTEFDHLNTYAYKYNRPGDYRVKLEVKDLDGLTSITEDTLKVIGQNLDIDTLIDERDGEKYRIVMIDGGWWMGENLRYGKIIPFRKEQTDNDTIERYQFTDWKGCDSIGGVYSWYEAMNYKVDEARGLCPEGWHIPTSTEWKKLYQSVPMSYAHKYYGENGFSGLDLQIGNASWHTLDTFIFDWLNSGFWTSSYHMSSNDYIVGYLNYARDNGFIGIYFIHAWRVATESHLVDYMTVRCKKDTE
jgi:uncharacterized protein (TIGR02145 family)